MSDPTVPVMYDAEIALVGCCIIDPNQIDKIRPIIRPGDITDDASREYLTLMMAMRDAGQTIDATTLKTQLKTAGRFDRTGGMEFLLRAKEVTVSPVAAPGYARLIAEAATRRRLMEGLLRQTDRIGQGHDIGDCVIEVMTAIEAAGGGGDDGAVDLGAVWDAGVADGFGFEGLDLTHLCDHRVTDECPLEVGRGLVSLIGGQPGRGKSALVEQIAWRAVLDNPEARVVLANVELSPAVILARAVCRESGLSGEPIPPLGILRDVLSNDQRQRRDAAAAELRPAMSRVTIPTRCREWSSIRQAVDTRKPDLLVLDYCQRVTVKPDAEPRQNIDALMGELRRVADGGAAVLAVSALNRASGRDGGQASFRESSELEYGADFAAVIVEDARREAVLRVNKARYGRLGDYIAEFFGSRLGWQIGGPVDG